MESVYRTWIHGKQGSSNVWDSEQLQKDLYAALGTTKWQLDEFQRTVQSSYVTRASVPSISPIPRCVELEKRATGCTSPNPMVGCVIVKDGEIVGEGFHPKADKPHAEW